MEIRVRNTFRGPAGSGYARDPRVIARAVERFHHDAGNSFPEGIGVAEAGDPETIDFLAGGDQDVNFVGYRR